jgi:hypothetical protein
MAINKEFELLSKLVGETQKVSSSLTTNTTNHKLFINDLKNIFKDNNKEIQSQIDKNQKNITEILNKTIDSLKDIINNNTNDFDTKLTRKFDSIDKKGKSYSNILLSTKSSITKQLSDITTGFKLMRSQVDDLLFFLKDEMGDLQKRDKISIIENKKDEEKEDVKKGKTKSKTGGIFGSVAMLTVLGTAGYYLYKNWDKIEKSLARFIGKEGDYQKMKSETEQADKKSKGFTEKIARGEKIDNTSENNTAYATQQIKGRVSQRLNTIGNFSSNQKLTAQQIMTIEDFIKAKTIEYLADYIGNNSKGVASMPIGKYFDDIIIKNLPIEKYDGWMDVVFGDGDVYSDYRIKWINSIADEIRKHKKNKTQYEKQRETFFKNSQVATVGVSKYSVTDFTANASRVSNDYDESIRKIVESDSWLWNSNSERGSTAELKTNIRNFIELIKLSYIKFGNSKGERIDAVKTKYNNEFNPSLYEGIEQDSFDNIYKKIIKPLCIELESIIDSVKSDENKTLTQAIDKNINFNKLYDTKVPTKTDANGNKSYDVLELQRRNYNTDYKPGKTEDLTDILNSLNFLRKDIKSYISKQLTSQDLTPSLIEKIKPEIKKQIDIFIDEFKSYNTDAMQFTFVTDELNLISKNAYSMIDEIKSKDNTASDTKLLETQSKTNLAKDEKYDEQYNKTVYTMAKDPSLNETMQSLNATEGTAETWIERMMKIFNQTESSNNTPTGGNYRGDPVVGGDGKPSILNSKNKKNYSSNQNKTMGKTNSNIENITVNNTNNGGTGGKTHVTNQTQVENLQNVINNISSVKQVGNKILRGIRPESVI